MKKPSKPYRPLKPRGPGITPALGDAILRRRLKLGWSQETLAAEAGLSARTIGSAERGRCYPSGETMDSIRAALAAGKSRGGLPR